MSKRDVLFLSMPSLLFVAMAALSLYYAGSLRPDPQRHQKTEKDIAELVQKAEKGEVSTDRLVKLLGDSWRKRDLLHETLAGFHSEVLKRCGYGVLGGVVLQFYVIFRVKAGLRKRDV